MKISVIGYGNMAKAIVERLIQENNMRIFVSSPSLSKETLVSGINTSRSNCEVIKDADLILIAVKPVKAKEVLQEIASSIPESALILSIMAGVNLKYLAQYCHKNQAIVRAMPNTAIAIGKGATALVGNTHISSTQRAQVELLFRNSGITTWLQEESLLDAITALSGSGPAYVFLFLEALIDAGQKLGLESALAKQFARQTLSGAVALLESSSLSPADLRCKVTSARGTTAAALAVLEQQGFKQLIYEALNAANTRAGEIGKEMSSIKKIEKP